MTTLPILDVGPYLAGEEGVLARLADELRDACENTGFYFMIHHGIPQELIDLAFNEAVRFHAPPFETKQNLKQGEHYVGYVGHGGTRVAVDDEAERGEEFVDRKNKPDLPAAYHINSDFPADHARCITGERFYIPQPWPDEDDLPGFRTNIQAYYAAVESLGHKLMPVYATALGVPTDYFDLHFEDALARLRLIHYPRVEQRVENQLGVGAQTTITSIPGADGEAVAHEPISYNDFLDWHLANAYKAVANSRVDAA